MRTWRGNGERGRGEEGERKGRGDGRRERDGDREVLAHPRRTNEGTSLIKVSTICEAFSPSGLIPNLNMRQENKSDHDRKRIHEPFENGRKRRDIEHEGRAYIKESRTGSEVRAFKKYFRWITSRKS